MNICSHKKELTPSNYLVSYQIWGKRMAPYAVLGVLLNAVPGVISTLHVIHDDVARNGTPRYHERIVGVLSSTSGRNQCDLDVTHRLDTSCSPDTYIRGNKEGSCKMDMWLIAKKKKKIAMWWMPHNQYMPWCGTSCVPYSLLFFRYSENTGGRPWWKTGV